MKRFFATAAVTTTATAVTAFAVPAIADTYYYAAGTRQADRPSQTSPNEWRGFLGQDHTPEAYTVQYPRDLAPLIGTTTLDDSVDEGVAEALRLISLHDDGGRVYLIGVSQGALVMARTKQALIADPDHGIDPEEITVGTFGDPVNPDGGFLAKLDRWNVNIPGFTPLTHTPGEGGYVTFAIEYDFMADAPDYPNPVSWANAAMGGIYDHSSYSYDLIQEAAAEDRIVSNAQEWYRVSDNGEVADQADAYYQHNLIKQKNLPLTRPLRDFGTSIADDRGDVVVNRAVDQLDNLLRPVVDAGYDGGQPGGTRHAGTLTKHYRDEDGNPVAEPGSTATSTTERTNRPLRDAVKNIRTQVKKAVNDTVDKIKSAAAPRD